MELVGHFILMVNAAFRAAFNSCSSFEAETFRWCKDKPNPLPTESAIFAIIIKKKLEDIFTYFAV